MRKRKISDTQHNYDKTQEYQSVLTVEGLKTFLRLIATPYECSFTSQYHRRIHKIIITSNLQRAFIIF